MRLAKHVHPSWHIGWTCCGIIVGAALAPLIQVGAWYLPLGGFGLLALALFKRLAWLSIAALVGGVCIGLWRGGIMQHDYAAYASFYGQEVVARGTVAEDTTTSNKGDQRLTIRDLSVDGRGMAGRIWVSTPKPHDIKRGDIVEITGRMTEGFSGVAASMHRAAVISVERPYPGDVARRVRDWFAEKVRFSIDEPEASLGLGFLTGQHSTLPEELDGQLRMLGLTHIVVASGYNLTVLVQVARRILAKTSKYLAALASGAMIASFMAITGLSPSMSRAGLVAGLSLLTWYYGRTMHPFVLLSFAAAVTLLVNPAYILGDIGWYLSFGSFVGVIVLSPLLQHYFWGDQRSGMFRQILIDTLSAQIVTLPIVMHTFGQYSPLALPANILVLPLVPLAMLLTFITGMLHALLPLGDWAGLPAELILRYMTRVVDWLGNMPFAQGEISFGMPWVVASYIGLAGILALLWRATGHDFRQSN